VSCAPVARRESPDGTDRTGADGRYTVGVASPGELDTVCVWIRVQAPVAGRLADRPDTAVSLSFRYVAPYDSARVDANLVPE
jgi:hypothetical protein